MTNKQKKVTKYGAVFLLIFAIAMFIGLIVFKQDVSIGACIFIFISGTAVLLSLKEDKLKAK